MKVEWISVEDRLPDMPWNTSDYYLVCERGFSRPQTALDFCYMKDDETWCTNEGRAVDVTHWMPHPELPTT